MKKKKNVVINVVLIFISIAYTVLVKFFDVKNIGPNNTEVGFSTINNYVYNYIKLNMVWYKISEYIGYLAILIVFIYAFIGLLQLIKRKSLKGIDKEIIALGVFYVLVMCIYIFFEKFVVNYRPYIIDGGLEASYPSSHTLLALCICGSGIIINNKLYNNKKHIKIINMILLIIMILILVGRIISGVHWISDIIGGILISSTLLSCYKTYINSEKTE